MRGASILPLHFLERWERMSERKGWSLENAEWVWVFSSTS